MRIKKENESWGIRNSEGEVVMGALREGVVWEGYFENLLNESRIGRAEVGGNWNRVIRGIVERVGERGDITLDIKGAVKSFGGIEV